MSANFYSGKISDGGKRRATFRALSPGARIRRPQVAGREDAGSRRLL